MRADAKANKDRILKVAQRIFAQKGTSTSIDEIAQEAEVGVGTLYRHFTNKEALIEALIIGRLEYLLQEARALLKAKDAGEAFFNLLLRFFGGDGDIRLDLFNLLPNRGAHLHASKPLRDYTATLQELLMRAQKQGAVRADVNISELTALIVSISTIQNDYKLRWKAWNIVIDGLRYSI